MDVALTLIRVPGPPVLDAETAAALKELVAKGAAGGIFFATDDCQATYEELKGRRVRVPAGAHQAALRHRRGLPRPVRQPDPDGADGRVM